MKYKVGDRVTIKEHKYGSCTKSKCTAMTGDMLQHAGKIAKITEVTPKHYYIDLDSEMYMWSECMFEKKGGVKMEIKVGNVYKVKDPLACGAFHTYNGDSIKITDIDIDGGLTYDILRGGKVVTNCSYCLNEKNLIPTNQKGKVLSTLYVVTYDIEDRDPVATFTSKKEMDVWLKEARTNTRRKFDSIKVYEAKKQYEVKTSFTLKLTK